jgi:hypothetical protein
MEIELRFKNSHHNHSYKFPGCVGQDNENNEFNSNDTILYDLHSNCEVMSKPVSRKVPSFQSNRRVKSE